MGADWWIGILLPNNCIQPIFRPICRQEYYGIEFFLRAGLNAEETAELYNTVEIVYDGIGRRRNIFFKDEAEEYFKKYVPKEDTTIE